MLQTWILPVLISYLLGSISFSYLITRYVKGIDIREHGSGNAGATNASRILGKKLALVVGVLDAVKAIVAIGVGDLLGHGDQLVMMACGVAAIIGHNWPIFLGFRGGKGVATTIGVAVVLMFYPALIVGILTLLTIAITRHVSLGSIVFYVLLPIAMYFMSAMYFMKFPPTMIWLTVLISVMGIWRHRQNIRNLFVGQERKL